MAFSILSINSFNISSAFGKFFLTLSITETAFSEPSPAVFNKLLICGSLLSASSNAFIILSVVLYVESNISFILVKISLSYLKYKSDSKEFILSEKSLILFNNVKSGLPPANISSFMF